MAHFLKRFLINLLVQRYLAPVLTHRGMQKILVDGRHFAFEDLVELHDDFDGFLLGRGSFPISNGASPTDKGLPASVSPA
jgi:hypothetical protein